jgi:superfamily II DNA helicase RecQ
MKELEKGMYNVIYGHPESLCSNTVMKMFNSRLYQQKVCAVVVDEVHMISEW